MNTDISQNTQAILLLTAPLIVAGVRSSTKPLTLGEYRRLAVRLREQSSQPSDLFDRNSKEREVLIPPDIELARITQLFERRVLLSQAIERWQARSIWVVSRADESYPNRLKKRMGYHSPPILYGCGDPSTLKTGGLAVVGSRNLKSSLVKYTETNGAIVANSGQTLVSGGARGADQAAMRGALNSMGQVVGVLPNNLESAVLKNEYRDALKEDRITLISPYDPAERFHVGNAMQRNTLIYALADAALVVNADLGKGGTWAGSVEQLEKLKYVPVYVRLDGEFSEGNKGLLDRGAIPWPNPATAEELEECIHHPERYRCIESEGQLF